MDVSLKQTIKLEGGKRAVVESLLGEGGQGKVYMVDVEGNKYALKWYKEIPSSEFIYNLRNNVIKGSPSTHFLWPSALTENHNGFTGYLMELRPSRYESFVSYLNGKVVFKKWSTLVDWCINISIAFKKLHEQGFSYQDINDGSFFLDPKTGDALICDNDNVTANRQNLGILGKVKYMAPEIARIDDIPDTHSDRHSLAVILFLAVCMGHPYEGEVIEKKYDFIDEVAEHEIYGTNPIFIFHRTDKTNRPIRGYHTLPIKRWQYLPSYIKEAFHKTFVVGLEDRENGRTPEIEWVRLLNRYRNELIECRCGFEYPMGIYEKDYDIDCQQKQLHSLHLSPWPHNKCPSCGSNTLDRTILHVNNHKVVLELNKKIYRSIIDKYSDGYMDVVGEVIPNKTNPNLWGIKNFTNNDVLITDSKGNFKNIPKGEVIPIVRNLTIEFNSNSKGVIK